MRRVKHRTRMNPLSKSQVLDSMPTEVTYEQETGAERLVQPLLAKSIEEQTALYDTDNMNAVTDPYPTLIKHAERLIDIDSGRLAGGGPNFDLFKAHKNFLEALCRFIIGEVLVECDLASWDAIKSDPEAPMDPEVKARIDYVQTKISELYYNELLGEVLPFDRDEDNTAPDWKPSALDYYGFYESILSEAMGLFIHIKCIRFPNEPPYDALISATAAYYDRVDYSEIQDRIREQQAEQERQSALAAEDANDVMKRMMLKRAKMTKLTRENPTHGYDPYDVDAYGDYVHTTEREITLAEMSRDLRRLITDVYKSYQYNGTDPRIAITIVEDFLTDHDDLEEGYATLLTKYAWDVYDEHIGRPLNDHNKELRESTARIAEYIHQGKIIGPEKYVQHKKSLCDSIWAAIEHWVVSRTMPPEEGNQPPYAATYTTIQMETDLHNLVSQVLNCVDYNSSPDADERGEKEVVEDFLGNINDKEAGRAAVLIAHAWNMYPPEEMAKEEAFIAQERANDRDIHRNIPELARTARIVAEAVLSGEETARIYGRDFTVSDYVEFNPSYYGDFMTAAIEPWINNRRIPPLPVRTAEELSAQNVEQERQAALAAEDAIDVIKRMQAKRAKATKLTRDNPGKPNQPRRLRRNPYTRC